MKTGTPTFSIIIPTHNSKATLRTPLNSLQESHCKDFEVIIVDDCSDSTNYLYEIASEYKFTINVIINKERSNASTTRNIGTANARGMLVCFLDDDDEFFPEKLSELQNYIKLNGIESDSIYINNYTVATNGKDIECINHKSDIELRSIDDYLFIQGKQIQTSSIAMSRDTAKRYPFDESFKRFQDLALLVSLKEMKGRAIVYSERPLSRWHRQVGYESRMIRGGFSRELLNRFINTYGPTMSSSARSAFMLRYELALAKELGSLNTVGTLLYYILRHPRTIIKKAMHRIQG